MAERKPKDQKLYRQCPQCGAVRAASEYPRSMGGKGAGFGSGWRSRCPACGHEALTWAFPPADPPAGGEEKGDRSE